MRDDDKQLKIELLSQWKLEAEARNMEMTSILVCSGSHVYAGAWAVYYYHTNIGTLVHPGVLPL